MTEQEKSIVCEKLCKYRAQIDRNIKAAKITHKWGIARYIATQRIILESCCNKCPMNEVIEIKKG